MTYDLSSHIGILLKNWDFEYQRLQLAVGEAPYLQKRNGSLPVVLCFSFFILPPPSLYRTDCVHGESILEEVLNKSGIAASLKACMNAQRQE